MAELLSQWQKEWRYKTFQTSESDFLPQEKSTFDLILFPAKRFTSLQYSQILTLRLDFLHENQKQCSLVLKYYRAPLSVQDISSTIDVSLVSLVMSDLSNVSISFTTAIVYLASGTFFFLLIFLLVMLGISDCHFLSRWAYWLIKTRLYTSMNMHFRCCCRCRKKKKYGPYNQIDWDALDLQVW